MRIKSIAATGSTALVGSLLLAACGSAGTASGPSAVVSPTVSLTGAPTNSAPAPSPSNASHSTKRVYLTFDDGPSPKYTSQILDVLRQYDAKATFFVQGNRVQKHPALLDAIKQDGHAVGNHTWSHPELTRVSNSEIRSQLERTMPYINTRCFRAPFGSTNLNVLRVAKRLGLKHVYWDVDTNDWRYSESSIKKQIQGAGNKSIILMHDGDGVLKNDNQVNRQKTVNALKKALPILAKKGYAFTLIPGCEPH